MGRRAPTREEEREGEEERRKKRRKAEIEAEKEERERAIKAHEQRQKKKKKNSKKKRVGDKENRRGDPTCICTKLCGIGPIQSATKHARLDDGLNGRNGVKACDEERK